MFIIFIKNFKDNNPKTKAAKQPRINGKAPTDSDTPPKSFASRIKAPRIAGIERIKENSPAVFLSIPQTKEAEIVIPDREIPGKVPQPCSQPIKSPF